MIQRELGEQTVQAVRICNYSEWYNKSLNSCVPCLSQNPSSAAFPLETNAERCIKCEAVLAGGLDDVAISDQMLGRLTYLCNNSEAYPRLSSLQNK